MAEDWIDKWKKLPWYFKWVAFCVICSLIGIIISLLKKLTGTEKFKAITRHQKYQKLFNKQ